MALVLKAKKNRAGDVKRFDVVRAENGTLAKILNGIDEGTYHVLDGNSVARHRVSYRVVQDIKQVG